MLRFINKETKSIIGAATIVGVLSFVSRIIGLIRDRILAGEFGAGDALDAYNAAFKIPDFIFSLIVIGAISASFIPIFTTHYGHKLRRNQAWKFANNTLHVLLFFMIIVSLIAFIFAQPLAGLIAPGFYYLKQQEVVSLMRIMLLSQVILTVSIIFGSVLQSLKRFFYYSLAPVFYNLGIIIGAVWFVDIWGVKGLAWGVVLGATLHFLIQMYGSLKAGYKYTFSFSLRDKDTIKMLQLTGPRVLGIATSQILLIVFAAIASTLIAGSVTIFQFAYNIQYFPLGIFGIAFAIAAFPALSEHAAKKQMNDFREIFSSTVRQMLFFLTPLSVIFLILRAQIVRVVVGAGQFDWAATILTADTLAFFALTFVPQAIIFILARAFFALHDTLTPLTAAVVSAIIGILSAVLLTKEMGVIGLAMAFSIAAVVNCGLLWVMLRQRIGSLGESKILITLYKVTTAGIVAGLITQSIKPFAIQVITLDTFFGVLSQGLLAGGAGLIAYGLVSYILKTEELSLFVNGLQKRVFKKALPEETFSQDSRT